VTLTVEGPSETTWEAPKPETFEPFAFRFPADFRPVREGLVLGVVIGAFVTLYLRLWRAPFRVPWAYHGDGIDTLEAIKSILSGGWNLHTARVGAPFVGSNVDFPSGGESVHWFSIKLLGYVLRSPSLTDNVYYLIGYFLVAFAAYYVARYLGLQKATALLVGVLYSFLPYHQVHGELHLVRSAYYIVPVDVLVMLWLVSWKTQLYRFADDGNLVLRRGRVAFALGVCVIQGVSDTITSGFAISIFVLIGVLLAINHWNVKPLKWGFIFAVAVGGTLLVANFPFIVARLTEGPNEAAISRSLLDQDVYGLRWVFMLLPIDGHWLGPLARLTAKARTSGDAVYTEPGQALGVLGGLGFLAIAATALAGSLGGPQGRSRMRSALQTLGTISVVAVLLASVGGLGLLIALFGFDLLRDWDRMVVIIGFLAYVGVALVLQHGLSAACRRYRRPTGPTWVNRQTLAIPVVAVLCVLGVADQAPPSTVPTYHANSVQYGIDAAFFHKLQAMVPPGSMIFQYPIMVYPENGPVYNLYDYDEFAGYIHTSTLRWSYGAVKGRAQGDWQTGTLSNLPIATQMAALSAIGFHGIWIARNGYADHGAALEASLIPLLGQPILVSTDNRMAYYDLAPMTRRIEAVMTPADRTAFAAGVLTAIDQKYGAGFVASQAGRTVTTHQGSQTAHLTLENVNAHAVTVDFTATIQGYGPGHLQVSAAGVNESVPIAAGTAISPVNVQLHLPRGETSVTFVARTVGPVPGSGGSWFRLSEAEVAPPAVHHALCLFEQGSTRPLDCG
jgi:phosphoglycerol transferase